MNYRRPYFIVIALDPITGNWSNEFGDFDKAVAQQEARDMKESGSHVKGAQYKVVKAKTAKTIDCDEARAAFIARA